MSFSELFPDLRPWVENLINVWPAYVIKPQFAIWQVWHILAIVVLGGASILVNLRLAGVGITSEPASVIRKNLWPWMHLGVFSIIVSGVLIGMANAERLYDSAAFLVKMLALAAAVIFTYGVTGPIARSDGRVGRGVLIAAIVGGLIWLAALYVFTVRQLINPGMFHVLTALALIALFVLRGRLRLIYVIGGLVLVAAQTVVTHAIIPAEDFARLDPANKAFAAVFTAWIIGFLAVQVLRRERAEEEGGALVKTLAYASILMWVTASAAGRWIAFA